ncbi:MAG: hypothetical protein ACLU9N_12950 [Clostridia bacterium]
MFRHKSIAIILSMMLVFTMIPSISFGDEISTIENQQNNLVSEEDNETPNDKTLPSKEDEIEKENAKDSVENKTETENNANYDADVTTTNSVVSSEQELRDAIESISDNDSTTITLGANISLNNIVEIKNGKKITLDLAGYTVTNNIQTERAIHVIGSELIVNGTVEGSGMLIPDSNNKSYGFIKIMGVSNVTLNGGTYSGDTDNGSFVKIVRNGTVDGSGSSVVFNNVDMTSNNRFFDTNTLLTEADVMTLNVEGGSYNTEGQAFAADTMYLTKLNFEGVQVTAGRGPCIEVCGSDATFTNCEFEVTNSSNPSHFSASAIGVSWDGIATIDSGNYTSTGYGLYVYNSGGTIVVKDGTISGGKAAIKADKNVQPNGVKSSITVEGGNTVGKWQTNDPTEASLLVKGGTHTENIEEYLDKGLKVEIVDGKYVVVENNTVFLNGTSGNDDNNGANKDNAVKSLDKALELVSENGTIYICGTVTIDSEYTLENANIKRAEGFDGILLSVVDGGKLTILDSTIDGNNESISYGSYLVFITNGGSSVIEDGTKIINNKTSAVYVNNNATLTMNGGEIKNNSSANGWGGGGILNCGTTTVNGGVISENIASTLGGGIYCERGTVTLNGGEIRENTAEQGAGIAVVGGNDVVSAILDGTTISGNKATYYGGGVYLQSVAKGGVKFEMKKGSVIGNEAKMTGAGIFGYVYIGPVDIKISGGTIKENVSTDENIGHAIGIYGYNGSSAYPRLELSGSPEIVGDVFYQNDYEDGYVIHVTDTFTPINSIEINRSNNIEGLAAVEYAVGISPNLEHFNSGNIYDGLEIEGQSLIWAKAKPVYFYDEDGTEYLDYRHGVIIGETINPNNVPAPEKIGYTLDGWHLEGETELWDFDNDTIENRTKLYAVWSLNDPNVSVEADKTTTHEDTDAILTAKVTHKLDDLDYTYQWIKDGNEIEGATTNTLNVSDTGNYTVKVTAKDTNSKTATVESAAVRITVEGHVYVPVVTKPTCTDKGYTTYTCEICKASYVDDYKDPVGHSYSDKWSSDANGHWHECTVCGDKTGIAAHTFKWVIDKNATTTVEGSKHEECTVCGYEKAAVAIPVIDEPKDSNAKTGDDFNIIAMLAIMGMAAAVSVFMVYSRRRSN